MDLYHATNLLDAANLIIPNAIIINETADHLETAATYTDNDTPLITTNYDPEPLLISLEYGITCYTPNNLEVYCIHSPTDTTSLPALHVTPGGPYTCNIIIDQYNSINATIDPSAETR